ncbi:MAG: hypothetical protein ACKO2G_00120 [Verrucomicrobiales bacterium]
MNAFHSPMRNLRGLVFAAALVGAMPAMATVDDAQSFALEAATSWVEKGVEIRYDYANGSTISGRKVRVSYQVFKGNSYWFFAGGSEDGVKFDMTVKDPDGKVVAGDLSKGNNSATYHFTAPRTMLVSIELTGTTSPGLPFDWAIVYGYKGKGKAAENSTGKKE